MFGRCRRLHGYFVMEVVAELVKRRRLVFAEAPDDYDVVNRIAQVPVAKVDALDGCGTEEKPYRDGGLTVVGVDLRGQGIFLVPSLEAARSKRLVGK